MLKATASLLAACVLASGCAATGPENSSVATLTSPLTSEATFRNLNRMVQSCLDNFAIQSLYYPEAKEGEITLKSKGDIFTATWIAIMVKPDNSGSTAGLVLLIAWIALPFAMFGIKPLLRELIAATKETNKLLREAKERAPDKAPTSWTAPDR